MQRPAPVAQALAKARYDAASIAPLEDYVVAQRGGSVPSDLEANLALLQLYTLHPTRRSVPHCVDVYLLAVQALPAVDHVAVAYALPADLGDDCKAVAALAALLETGALGKFWAALAAQPKLVAGHARFAAEVRRFVLATLQATYQSVRQAELAEALNVPLAELKAQPGAGAWTFTEDLVHFPLTDENQARPKKIAETIHFEQLSKVLASTQ